MNVNSIGSAATTLQPKGTGNSLGDLDLEGFIALMITELQNQDPLNPMDNGEILDQISQIQSIQSTGKLTDTLEAVLLGQNLASASSMLGQLIQGMTDDGRDVSGRVQRVSVEDGVPKLIVEDEIVSLTNVKEILPDAP